MGECHTCSIGSIWHEDGLIRHVGPIALAPIWSFFFLFYFSDIFYVKLRNRDFSNLKICPVSKLRCPCDSSYLLYPATQ